MNTPAITSSERERGWRGKHNRAIDVLARVVSHDLLAVTARVAIASVFWLSGRTKVEGWLDVTDTAVYLFMEEYSLPLLTPSVAAHLAAYAEHLFPIALILGLFTRFSAIALLGMAAVIQIFVYPDAWPTHLTWVVSLLYLLGRGAGRLSIDHALGLR